MKIYFAGSIKWSKVWVEIFPDIIRALEKYGKVLTEHIWKVHQDQEANIATTPSGVFIQDKKMLDQADVIVADITAASLWVGREISYCENIRKIPVYCIYNKHLTNPSWMITWNSYNKVYGYETIEDITTKILPEIFWTTDL